MRRKLATRDCQPLGLFSFTFTAVVAFIVIVIVVAIITNTSIIIHMHLEFLRRMSAKEGGSICFSIYLSLFPEIMSSSNHSKSSSNRCFSPLDHTAEEAIMTSISLILSISTHSLTSTFHCLDPEVK